MKKTLSLLAVLFVLGLIAAYYLSAIGDAVHIDGIISHYFVKNKHQVFLVEADGLHQITTYDSETKRWIPVSRVELKAAVPFEGIREGKLEIDPENGLLAWTDQGAGLNFFSVYDQRYETLEIEGDWESFPFWAEDEVFSFFWSRGEHCLIGRFTPISSTMETIATISERPAAGFQSKQTTFLVLEDSMEVLRIDKENEVSTLLSVAGKVNERITQIQQWVDESVILVGEKHFWEVDLEAKSINKFSFQEEIVFAWADNGEWPNLFYFTPRSGGGMDLIGYDMEDSVRLKELPGNFPFAFWFGREPVESD